MSFFFCNFARKISYSKLTAILLSLVMPMAVEEVLFNGNERIVRFGIYELHIKEGKKYLTIKN